MQFQALFDEFERWMAHKTYLPLLILWPENKELLKYGLAFSINQISYNITLKVRFQFSKNIPDPFASFLYFHWMMSLYLDHGVIYDPGLSLYLPTGCTIRLLRYFSVCLETTYWWPMAVV